MKKILLLLMVLVMLLTMTGCSDQSLLSAKDPVTLTL